MTLALTSLDRIASIASSYHFRAADFDGKMADLRATVVRKNIDTYSWQLEEKQPGPWKPLLSLEYRRTYPPTFLSTSAR